MTRREIARRRRNGPLDIRAKELPRPAADLRRRENQERLEERFDGRDRASAAAELASIASRAGRRFVLYIDDGQDSKLRSSSLRSPSSVAELRQLRPASVQHSRFLADRRRSSAVGSFIRMRRRTELAFSGVSQRIASPSVARLTPSRNRGSRKQPDSNRLPKKRQPRARQCRHPRYNRQIRHSGRIRLPAATPNDALGDCDNAR